MKELSTMGGRVRAARKAAGLSQEQVAERTGLSQGTISDIENNKQGTGYAPELAAVLGVEALWLKAGTEPRKRGQGRVDTAVLRDALVAVMRVTEGKEPPDRLAKLAAALYEAGVTEGRLNAPALLKLLRAMAP